MSFRKTYYVPGKIPSITLNFWKHWTAVVWRVVSQKPDWGLNSYAFRLGSQLLVRQWVSDGDLAPFSPSRKASLHFSSRKSSFITLTWKIFSFPAFKYSDSLSHAVSLHTGCVFLISGATWEILPSLTTPGTQSWVIRCKVYVFTYWIHVYIKGRDDQLDVWMLLQSGYCWSKFTFSPISEYLRSLPELAQNTCRLIGQGSHAYGA